MNEPTIHLELSVAEVNLILETLGDQPFKTVYGLVSRLQSQAQSQLNPQANGNGADALASSPGMEEVP
jgi:hypothetical protein